MAERLVSGGGDGIYNVTTESGGQGKWFLSWHSESDCLTSPVSLAPAPWTVWAECMGIFSYCHDTFVGHNTQR